MKSLEEQTAKTIEENLSLVLKVYIITADRDKIANSHDLSPSTMRDIS